MHDFWIVRMRPWAPPGRLPGHEKGGGKAPNAEALKLLEDDRRGISCTHLEGERAFPNHFGDLIYLTFQDGAALMEGMRYSKEEDAYYFYPEPEELRKRFADLAEEEVRKFQELSEQIKLGKPLPENTRILDLGEIERFVALYEAAFKDKTDWEQVCENADLDPNYDETKDDDASEEDWEATELVGEEVTWGDPKLMAPKRRPVPGEFHREPVIILHQ